MVELEYEKVVIDMNIFNKWVKAQLYLTVIMQDEQVMGTAIRKAVEKIAEQPEFKNPLVQQVIVNNEKEFTIIVNLYKRKK